LHVTNHFTWAEAVVAMGIALTTAHPSQMAAVAALDPARPDTAHFASSIGKSSSRRVVSMVMAPTRHIPMPTHRLPFSAWRRSDSRLSERQLTTD
jgi:hypothetical protein